MEAKGVRWYGHGQVDGEKLLVNALGLGGIVRGAVGIDEGDAVFGGVAVAFVPLPDAGSLAVDIAQFFGLAKGRPVVEQGNDVDARLDADRLDGTGDALKVNHNADCVLAGPRLTAAELPSRHLGS